MNTLELAHHIDRMSRNCSAHRPSARIVELAAGWLRHGGVGADDENPSMARNRISWLGLSTPTTEADVTTMLQQLRALHCGSVFLWASTAALNTSIEATLAAWGARVWPHVRYIAFTRQAQTVPPPTPTGCPFSIRQVASSEINAVYQTCSPWYSTAGATDATALVLAGIAEAHAAFLGDQPIAISLLIPDGPFAYLGWAGTDPQFRNRGAQTALIAARLRRAAELGTTHCVSETNTMVEASLKNLLKSGFVPAAEWKVFAWTTGVA